MAQWTGELAAQPTSVAMQEFAMSSSESQSGSSFASWDPFDVIHPVTPTHSLPSTPYQFNSIHLSNSPAEFAGFPPDLPYIGPLGSPIHNSGTSIHNTHLSSPHPAPYDILSLYSSPIHPSPHFRLLSPSTFSGVDEPSLSIGSRSSSISHVPTNPTDTGKENTLWRKNAKGWYEALCNRCGSWISTGSVKPGNYGPLQSHQGSIRKCREDHQQAEIARAQHTREQLFKSNTTPPLIEAVQSDQAHLCTTTSLSPSSSTSASVPRESLPTTTLNNMSSPK